MKKRIVEIAVKVIVAALTAFLTAITTTSCMGYGPLPKIVQISLMKNPLADAGGFFVEKITILHYKVIVFARVITTVAGGRCICRGCRIPG